MAKISKETPIKTINEVPSRFARRRIKDGILVVLGWVCQQTTVRAAVSGADGASIIPSFPSGGN
ncbi:MULTISPECIES: hypothetical protein [unclassified Ensifer]|uniref:hypothetical protein n=1 Tax=unclassified Ensifer TaxID=2633371 RepID=UPI001431FD0D|nr:MULTISPECIES: hypothetical protein [unclassified Ensifer]